MQPVAYIDRICWIYRSNKSLSWRLFSI